MEINLQSEEKMSTLSSLSRFRLQDEHLVADDLVKKEIKTAFADNRCFYFFPDADIVAGVKKGDPIALYRESLIAVKNRMFDDIAQADGTIKNRLLSDIRLSSSIMAGLMFIHRALAEGDVPNLIDRRFVLVREKPGVPTIYHISNETTVIAHVGQGPQWSEIASLYLGLNIFDALHDEMRKGERRLFDAFISLLRVEARAIETGYSHTEIFHGDIYLGLNLLVDEVIRISTFKKAEYRAAVPRKKVKKFTARDRDALLQMLNARMHGDELNFDFKENMAAIERLEKLAKMYKRGDDIASLREIVRLLVAASGHDFHEVRDRANMLLERIFAPKEFDAPVATAFATIHMGGTHRFEFDLAAGRDYFLRIYRYRGLNGLCLEGDLDYEDMPLDYDAASKRYVAQRRFDEYGHFDYVVFEKRKRGEEWVHQSGASGRINVMPDVRGEIILEIFPDIHGHTKVYWMEQSGHPGLVYNEHGEVIRLGRFSDITAHLEDLQRRYFITAVYLLGVQTRGSNRDDWAPEASSPSPFSPMSLVEIEPSLGGEKEFIELVRTAHDLGIKVIVDIVPHLNRRSDELPDRMAVKCYDNDGNLVVRASTDGRYGSWNDGKLFNYRMFEVWEWLANSIDTLIRRYDIDGIRFDSAHAVPIMMKKNNYLSVYNDPRPLDEMVEGSIIVNDREDGHFITTGYYDCACRDIIAIPLHYYLMLVIQKTLESTGKNFFINIAECYWGHERFLTRTGIVPYNSALFKICENIIHGKTDVREIYHIYDNYFPSVMPPGTEMLGILGNHDERRALNTFGHRGLRAAVGITTFMNNIIMDYEGSAEGEGWKVYLDNIFVNWNQFEFAAHRSLELFYRDWYSFHRNACGKGYLVWANNNAVAAAVKFTDTDVWIGAFNFSDANQPASIQFDNPVLPIQDDVFYRVADIIYSPITRHYAYFTGRELKTSKLHTVVTYTDRFKLLKLETVTDPASVYDEFLRDSFLRLATLSNPDHFMANFSFMELCGNAASFRQISKFVIDHLIKMFWEQNRDFLELGLKRAFFYMVRSGSQSAQTVINYIAQMAMHEDERLRAIGESLKHHNRHGSIIFMSAEADPFSKSGGLANVVYELPREMAKMGEEVYVITGMYRHGDPGAVKKMQQARQRHNAQYTGRTVRFRVMDAEYNVGVHRADVDGVTYFLLDHHELFDGLYWGYTAEEKLRRRIAFARASAELIVSFGLNPLYTFTNDAYTGLFNGVVRCDHVYRNNPNFVRTTFLHIIHNGGWQYFDSYKRHENGLDLFRLFNLPPWRANDFSDPVRGDELNCMAAGVRFADKVVTVSPSYAKQIEFACDGLERILSNVMGISNAIGRDFRDRINAAYHASGFADTWYPKVRSVIAGNDALMEKISSRFPEIPLGIDNIRGIEDPVRRYTAGRLLNKMMLQCQRGLAVDPDAVLFIMIHRITEQKGFQLVLDASEGLFKNLGYQAIIGGSVSSGDRRGEEIAHGLHLLSTYYPGSVNVAFGFQDVSIPLLAGDIFCMPSMNEPGGISQLEAFTAGCLVVARATGGLRDTVFPVRQKEDGVAGNGFLFSDYSAHSFYDAMERASQFLRSGDERMIYEARKNAEKTVYYWDRPAKKYIEEIYHLKEIIRII